MAALLKYKHLPVTGSAALALGRMGEAAKSAVPALVAPLEVIDPPHPSAEEVQVVCNITYALGDIGADARSAVPALKKLQRLRIKHIAEQAVGSIEGSPRAAWH